MIGIYCVGCIFTKSAVEFGSNRAKYGGIDNYCLECRRKKAKEYRAKYPEKIKAANQRPDIKSMKMAYKKTKAGKASEQRWEKTESCKAIRRKYRSSERGKALCCATKRRRDARKLDRTPRWLTECQLMEIKQFYVDAKELQWLSDPSDPLEVDHIIPLQGKNVSGLHVPWNLQILPQSENRSKGNR